MAAANPEILNDGRKLSKMSICDGDETNVFDEPGLFDMTTEPMRLDPPGSFGQSVTMVVTVTSKDEEFANKLSKEDRNTTLTSVVNTAANMLMRKNYSWEKDGRKFIDYCELMSRLREDRIELMYGASGIEFKFPVHVRSVNELDELWTEYCSAELERSIREHFAHVYSPLGPLEIAVRIDDYDAEKKKFESAE